MLRLRQRSPRATSSTAVALTDEPTPLALLEFQSPTAAIIAQPVPVIARMMNLWITLMVFGILILSSFMKVDKIISTTGELQSTAATAVIQPFVASIVRQVNVQEGELVHKGQVLAALDPTDASADLTALTAQQQAYSAQVQQLQAQENGMPYEPDPANPASALQLQTYTQQVGQYNFTVDDYSQKIKALQTGIDGYNAQAAYYRQRLGVASNVESMRKNLQQLQVGSKLDTLAATDDRLNMQSSLASAVSSAQQNERDLASQQAERDAFVQQWKANTSTQLSTAINNLTTAEQSLAKARLADQLVVLKAPQDAIVQTVAQVTVGSVLQSGATLMQLVPVNAPLTVSVDINGEDSGYVHVGDEAVIKFDTLPFLQYGTAKGRVINVSPDSFNPQDQATNAVAGAPLPSAPQALYYKAVISMDVLNLHNTPPGFRIVPGMPLGADIKVGTRSVLGYFTRKMLPVAYNSLHEP